MSWEHNHNTYYQAGWMFKDKLSMFLANLSGKVSGMKVYKISNFLPSIWFVINLFHHDRKMIYHSRICSA